MSGQVASVESNTITVNSVDPSGNSSQTTVTVSNTTKYTKKTAADAQAIAQGKCLTALGTKDGGGALQATAITVQQADNGQCAEPGGGLPPALAGRYFLPRQPRSNGSRHARGAMSG